MQAKILVVDDEPDLEQMILQKFRKQIRSREYEFLFAENGVEALEKLGQNGDFDLVLTDINMPEMDGLTLLSKLQELNVILKPVIVSAYGDMANIRIAMNRGAFDFVTKPIDLHDLEVTVNKSLTEMHMLREAIKAHDKLVAIEMELSVATEIQTSILPQTFPPFPDRKEFDIHARMLTANEVGGDFYDFFPIDKYRIGFTVGDVTGKGVPAAMLMAVSRTLLKYTALRGISPDACMAEINNVLVEESKPEMFVTIFYGVLDTRNGMMEYCNGGHNPPYLVSADGNVKQLEMVGGIFVGAVREAEYRSNVLTLQPGDAVFLYSDGVTEAMDLDQEEFLEAGLEKSLQNKPDASVTEMTEQVMQDVQTWAKGAPQSDDITVLALKYNGQ
ncbi:MAG: PP2C family protein-serine/threonine phosphatase [bacterium]